MNMSKELIAMVNSMRHDLNQRSLMFWQQEKLIGGVAFFEKRRKSRRLMHLHLWKEKRKIPWVVKMQFVSDQVYLFKGRSKRNALQLK